MQKKLNKLVALLQSDAALTIAQWVCGAAIVAEEFLPEGTPKYVAKTVIKACVGFGIYSMSPIGNPKQK